MIFSVIFIISILSIFVANGSILGTGGDYEIYKDLLYDLNLLNINWEDINLIGGDLWQEVRRYGLIWILIMKIHSFLFGDNIQIFLFNLSFISLSVKYFFLKLVHKSKYQILFAFILYLSTLFVVQEALRLRASLSVCFGMASIYFLNKSTFLSNKKRFFYISLFVLFLFVGLNINVNGFYFALIFFVDYLFKNIDLLSKINDLKIFKKKYIISFFSLVFGYLFSSFLIRIIFMYGGKGLIPRLFPYLISDSTYFSALYIIPVILSIVLHNLISSKKTISIPSSNITPFYISIIIGMIIKSQYLLYGALNMSYFYILSFNENLSNKSILFVFLILSGYYFLIRTLPLVLFN